MEIVEEFSVRLKQAMEMKKMSQSELVRETGISKSLISRYLSGNHKANNVRTYELARALGVSPLWLMGFDVPPVETEESRQIKNEINTRLNTMTDEELKKILKFITEFF